jgi:hypothetical protein
MVVDKEKRSLTASTAFRFVIVIGVANLFADMTYEGARSSTGQFLGSLGASAAVVGFTAGLGELLGYALRSVSGVISDKTGKYWIVTIVGYTINMLAVPALALAGNWPLAAGLIVAERTGRAIRKPSTEAMLSFAGKYIGQGWVFGLNEALESGGRDHRSSSHVACLVPPRKLSEWFCAPSRSSATGHNDCSDRALFLS